MVGLGSLTEALISVAPPGTQCCFGLIVLTVGKRQFPSFQVIFPMTIALTPQTKESVWVLSELPSISIKMTHFGTGQMTASLVHGPADTVSQTQFIN